MRNTYEYVCAAVALQMLHSHGVTHGRLSRRKIYVCGLDERDDADDSLFTVKLGGYGISEFIRELDRDRILYAVRRF